MGLIARRSFFVMHKFAVEPWQVGLMLVLMGIATAVTQAVLLPRLVPQFGEKRLAVVALVAHALAALATFFAPVFWLIYPISILGEAIGGFIFSTMTTLGANRVTPREQGVFMGVTTALGSLMSIFGPLWAGTVYDR